MAGWADIIAGGITGIFQGTAATVAGNRAKKEAELDRLKNKRTAAQEQEDAKRKEALLAAAKTAGRTKIIIAASIAVVVVAGLVIIAVKMKGKK